MVFLILLVMHQLLPASTSQENNYKPKNILRFAEHLYQERDYLRAAGEFQRYLYYFNSFPSDADVIFHKIGLCYRFAGEFQRSTHYFQQVIDSFPQSIYLNDSYYQIALAYFLMSKYEESISISNINFSLVNSRTSRLKIQQLKGISYIYQKKWNNALDLLGSIEKDPKNNYLTAQLVDFAEQGKKLPKKSKFLAGLMSSIIPGSGKMYAHRTSDGFVSLLTIGLTGWQAYSGFHKDGVKSVRGWIYGTITAFLYLGNIYGSVVAVNIYNQQLEDKLFERISVTVNVHF